MFRRTTFVGVLCAAMLGALAGAQADDLREIKARGAIRHLGVPYANFVTGAGDGFSVDIVKMFAQHLGVRYAYVETDWDTVIPDLIGRKVKASGGTVELGEVVPVRGDLIANGLTIIPWRQKVVRFSTPDFPTQIWFVVRSDSPIRPIEPSGDLRKDIAAVRTLLRGHSILGKVNTCLDPTLYDIVSTGARSVLFAGSLNDMAGAVIKGETEATLLDVPDALVALKKWPGMIKVVGPLSPAQEMGVGFRPDSPQLHREFEKFLHQIKRNGTYRGIVEKYYPLALSYFPEFFK
ncbi:ABC transporter substrate-binding protein [Shumkonia mesophila]|uniref:ABC transporter substrate-binding protein n=1 Tax=Shumkonia mesophila TaxID=2838854 RepID=UPI0029347920|nr:transporter substrate-binding domain-containing protein [Shumkonia mesophila]